MATLEIKDLHVSVKDEESKEEKEILKGVNLKMKTGEIHAIMDQMELVSLLFLKPSWVILTIMLQKAISFLMGEYC